MTIPSLRRLAVAVVLAASAHAGVAPTASAATGPQQCTESGPSHSITLAPTNADVDYILELASGEDPDHWAHYVLDQIDIPALNQDARIIYTYVCAINGVWLRVTESEADKIDVITGARPVWAKGSGRAFEVTLPIVTDSVVNDYTLIDPQITPAWLERLQWPGPLEDDTDVTVAILDTGVDYFNVDLTDTIIGGYDCTHEYADRWQYDPYGHGTHVWGSYAALDNDRHVVGGAAGTDGAVGVRGYAIPVLNGQGFGSSASVLCGIDQGMLFDADIANLSLGGMSPPSQCGQLDPSHNGFCTAVSSGMTIVVSAGNSASDAYWQSPANYPEVLTIAAMAAYPNGVLMPGCSFNTPENAAALFTSWGSVVDATAPGVCTPSTVPGNRVAWASGTSMAAPAAGAVIAHHFAVCQTRDTTRVMEWSTSWMRGTGGGDYFWPHGPTPPLMRFGAPCPSEDS